MHKSAPAPSMAKLEIPLLLIVAAGLLFYYLRPIWTYSSDMAHHYALISYLAENWQAPLEHVDNLGEMNFYPRLSHGIAAALVHLLQSPLLAMQLVAVGAMVFCWIGLLAILRSLPPKSSWYGAGLLLCLLLVNEKFRLMDLHGGELFENYFFAQIVAQAFALCAIALSLLAEQKQVPDWLRTLFLMLMIYVITGMHLLPATQLMGLMAAMLVLDLWSKRHLPKTQWAWHAARAVFFLAVTLYLFITHPSYAAMQELSANNGALSLRSFNSKIRFYSFALLVALLSLWSLRKWYLIQDAQRARDLLACKYLALAGLVASSICLLQACMLYFDTGSDYAVKKHAFSISSLFVLQLACLPALLSKQPQGKQEGGQAIYLQRFLFMPLVLLLCLPPQIPASAWFQTPELLKIERELLAQAQSLRSLAQGKQVLFIGEPGVKPALSYLFSVGSLRAARDSNSLDILLNKLPSQFVRVGKIVMQPGPFAQRHAACREPFAAMKLVVLDGECVARELGVYRAQIDFSMFSHAGQCTLSGFGRPEYKGRWSIQNRAGLNCQVLSPKDGRPPRTLVLKLEGFVHQKLRQRVGLSLDGKLVQEIEFNQSKPQQVVRLPLPANQGRELSLQFSLPDAISPTQTGQGNDPRQLGVMLSSLEFE